MRELSDGSAGLRAGGDNAPDVHRARWAGYRDRLEQIAREAAGHAPSGGSPRARLP